MYFGTTWNSSNYIKIMFPKMLILYDEMSVYLNKNHLVYNRLERII